MRVIHLLILCAISVCGCKPLTIRTESRVAVDNALETRISGMADTRVEMPPVSPTAGRVQPVIVQPGDLNGQRVAVVDVDGLILNTPFVGPSSVGENPVALFREKLDVIEAEGCVRAVILRVNSPGGGVAACSAMRRDLERFKARTQLPVIASLPDLATGGAYHLASVADVVVVEPNSVTGGLGVILNLYNFQDLMGLYNVIPQTVKAGELADIGTSTRSLKQKERELLQTMADEFHTQIRTDVTKSRPKVDAKEVFDGRILTGKQAVERGLADKLGDLDDAIRMASEIACQGVSNTLRPEVVLYRRANDPANSVYAVTANIPLQGAGLFPSIPGLDRAKLPTFLSVWQPELSMEKLSGK